MIWRHTFIPHPICRTVNIIHTHFHALQKVVSNQKFSLPKRHSSKKNLTESFPSLDSAKTQKIFHRSTITQLQYPTIFTNLAATSIQAATNTLAATSIQAAINNLSATISQATAITLAINSNHAITSTRSTIVSFR